MKLFTYILENKGQILNLLTTHIKLVSIAVSIAILIGVPVGIIISYRKSLKKPLLGFANVMQAIPSMALLGFMIPFLGIGTRPAITAVVIYSLLPIIKNTTTGIGNINPQTIEAARGIGLTKFQILTKIQIPLALPIIMAGVRISSVSAVGFMTIAAFIGAGGLGYLVFSGIRSVNNIQILAGAIPACLLALTVDFIGANIEQLVTPISLQKNISKEKRRFSKVILGVFFAFLISAFSYTYFTSNKNIERVLVVGSKEHSEQLIVSNMIADLVEAKTDITVIRKLSLGGTHVSFSAMKNSDIDMYVEYVGTIYSFILKNKPISDMDEVYRESKTRLKDEYDIICLKPMAFNNTNVLAVRQDTADKYNLKTVSDLVKVGKNLKFGGTFEFLNEQREDGLIGMERVYGLHMGETVAIDGSPRYISINSKETDVTNAYSTDALLKKFKLVTLEDDKKFLPPFYAVPIIRKEILKKYPEIVPLIEELGKTLTEDVMIELNYQVDEDGLPPEIVSLNYLKEKGFI